MCELVDNYSKAREYKIFLENIDNVKENVNVTLEKACEILHTNIEDYYVMKQFIADFSIQLNELSQKRMSKHVNS